MNTLLAYFLTWRTYGSWLHGDPRGSVDGAHAGFGTPPLAPSAVRVAHVRSRMKFPSVTLDESAKRIVAEVIQDHCRIRNWSAHEFAVLSNHVHVVVGFAGLAPEPMMAQFKAYATRALRRSGITKPDAPMWAEGGSTRYLWTGEHVNAACAYVRDGQDVPRQERVAKRDAACAGARLRFAF